MKRRREKETPADSLLHRSLTHSVHRVAAHLHLAMANKRELTTTKTTHLATTPVANMYLDDEEDDGLMLMMKPQQEDDDRPR